MRRRLNIDQSTGIISKPVAVGKHLPLKDRTGNSSGKEATAISITRVAFDAVHSIFKRGCNYGLFPPSQKYPPTGIYIVLVKFNFIVNISAAMIIKKILIFLLCIMPASLVQAQRETLVVPDGQGLPQDMVMDKQQKYLYTMNHAKVVMWEVATGRQLYSFKLDGEDVYGLAVSNDGKKIAVAAQFKNYCFSTVTGKMLFKTTEHGGISNGVIFSPDDKTIYAGNEGLWEVDANTGKSDNKIFGNYSGDGKLFYIDNNTKLVVTGGEGWEVYDMVNKQKLYSHATGLQYLAALPEQGYVIAGRNHDVVKVFDIKSGKEVKQLAGNSYNAVVIPSVNSHQLIFCADDIDAPQRVIYNTDNFTIEKRISKRISDVKHGLYFGKENMAYVLDGLRLVKFNTADESIVKAYEGVSANFGSEFFNSKEYNVNTGMLHITTEESNLKTIDLYHMRPVRHTVINTGIKELAFSPSGDTIAAFDNAPFSMVIKNIVSAATVRPVTKTGMTAQNRNLYFFAADATKLYYPEENSRDDRTTLMRYDLLTKTTSPLIKARILDNVFVNSSKDLLVAVETSPETISYGVWDIGTGKRLLNVPVKDGSGKIDFLSVSKDKKQLLVMQAGKLLYYELATGKLTGTSAELQRTETSGTFIAGPGKNGVSAASSDLSLYAFSRSDQDIKEKGELFVYKRSGEMLYRIQAHSDIIRSILFSPDDKLIYTISYDKTIKVWDTQTGKLLGTLYLFKNSNDYVFVDSDGRFDGSPEGLKQLYFIKNRDMLALDKLYEKYYTPNLYQRLVNGEVFTPLATGDLKKAPIAKIKYAETQRNLTVDDDVPTYQNTTGAAEITVTASAEDDDIDEIRLFQNGKALNLATRNLIVEDDQNKTSTKKYTISLLPGTNEIRAVALNTQRTESQPDIINVLYANGTSANNNVTPVVNSTNRVVDQIDKAATLHLVVVGINAYKNPAMSLNYALADATAFKDEIEKDARSVLTNVKTYFVTDAAADKTGISKALEQVQQTAKPQDVFVFYYAGHGVIAKGNNEFYLVPNDVSNLHDVDEALKQHGIAAKELQQYAINIQAQKQLFVLDACQSAGAFTEMLKGDGDKQKNIAMLARSTGTHWMAASGSQQYANEFSTLGHGAFTYVLLQALKGEAASNKMITVDGLKLYLQTGVPALMKKYNGSQQTPASYGFGNDFPVEIMR